MRVRALNPAGNGSAATAVVGKYGIVSWPVVQVILSLGAVGLAKRQVCFRGIEALCSPFQLGSGVGIAAQ